MTALFSICIPQYNRTSFLRVLLDSILAQTFKDLEICISDGGSIDSRQQEVVEWLLASGLAFRYARSQQNLPYDENLRKSVGLARGRYCLLFGNDDALAERNSLEELAGAIRGWGLPEVVLTNYRELGAGTVRRRVGATGLLGAGPEAAVRNFRNFSFVSGIVLERDRAQALATERWDGGEMYQAYLACRMIAEGGRLFGLDRVMVLKDVPVPGEIADSYARKPRVRVRGISEITLPLSLYGRIAFDAIAPYVDEAKRRGYATRIMGQVLGFTFPPWLVEYRRVQSWRFAAGFALGMRPGKVLGPLEIGWRGRCFLWGLYLMVTLAGLVIPQRLFFALRPRLYCLAKMGSLRREKSSGRAAENLPPSFVRS